MEKPKQYIYIIQLSNETNVCKIGKTGDLDARLKTYNSYPGVGASFKILFACEVSDMSQVEGDITNEFRRLREKKRTERYFYNEDLFTDYVKFIKAHPLFVKEVVFETEETVKKIVEVEKIIKKTTPSLKKRGISRKDVMENAKKIADDEFYTRYEDIEKEIKMYDKNVWNDKVVFCNCDDAVDKDERKTSAFALYFIRNFNELNLKKLICTHYTSKVDLFNAGANGYIFTKDGYSELEDDYDKMKEFPKDYNGSFDHPLSLKILNEEADIVCTNPPFSPAKKYWKLLIESGKKFLFIGNSASIQTTAYIHYFKDNKVWAGYNRVDWFETPKSQLTMAPGQWFTNIPISDRPRYKNLKIVPLKDIPDKYRKFDDKGTLLVYFNYIPSDYAQPFAVSAFSISSGLLEKGYKIVQAKRHNVYIDGKEKYARVLVQKV